jgi:hypothetical protein
MFEAHGRERVDLDVAGGEPPRPNSSIGYARIEDGEIVPDPFIPVFTTMAGVAVTRSEHGPAISCEGGIWMLYYEASDPATGLSEGLFRALPY